VKLLDPYSNATFFEWFYIFVQRLFSSFFGEGLFSTLFADEIQLIVMGLFSLSASFLGVWLVAKRLTMMANALSHTMLLGIVISYILYSFSTPPLFVLGLSAIIVALATGVLIEVFSSLRFIKEDAGNGIVFSSFFAFGILLLSVLGKNAFLGHEVLTGDPDALDVEDIPFVFWVTCVTLVVGLLFFRGYCVAVFDAAFFSLSGFRPKLVHVMLLVQVALVTVSSFRAVGVVMTLSFFVFPSLIARLFTYRIKNLIICAMGIALGTTFISVALSRHILTAYCIPLSTGALSASLLAVWYVLCMLAKFCIQKSIGKRVLGNDTE
jgi:manganese/zinc/iron transport system permease protein